jgi:hypothetical protein
MVYHKFSCKSDKNSLAEGCPIKQPDLIVVVWEQEFSNILNETGKTFG